VNPSPTYVTFVTIRFHAFPVTHQTAETSTLTVLHLVVIQT